MPKRPSPPPSLPAYTVRRSDRAKSVRLRVLADGTVEVVVPKRARVTGWDAFVAEHADWIRRHLGRMAHRESAPPSGFAATGVINYRGVPCPDQVSTGAAGRVSVRWDGAAFHVATPDGNAASARPVLEGLFQARAKDVFTERVHALNTAGYAWTSVRVADQKTRWGSCSKRGTLSFNWRLLLAPPEVLDYVVVHELAHLKEMNHAPAFWALVEAACPDYRRHTAWLKENGSQLKL